VSGDLRSIVGVYDADGTLAGEVRYWFGARIGRAHCDLCDISHGTFRAKAQWRALVESSRVPLVTWHRDDAPPDVLAATGGRLAAVVAVTDDGERLLLGPEHLAALGGDVARFAEAVDAQVVTLGYGPVFGR
jgi:hypothetical protein